MKRITTLCAPYLSLWHGLLALALIILMYLTGVHISEALNTSSCYTVFNAEQAFLSWEPSRGEVDHYLLEITDTHLLGNQFSTQSSSMSTIRYATSALTIYRLACSHNHSYQVRVKAISPCGASSEYSEPSILFICDQEPPRLMIDPLPYPQQKVRSQNITLTGRFDEAHLSSIVLNDVPAAIDYQLRTFRTALTLTPGENSIVLHARDLAGNASTESSTLTYAPVTILSFPANARLYWNGNYAYAGSYGGTTPRSYNHAGQQKQTLRISLPGFQDFFGIIDFSDLSRDSYSITLNQHVPSAFTHIDPLVPAGEGLLPHSNPHPCVVDYNLDGAKDLLVGNADGTVGLFINRGSNDMPVLSDKEILLNSEDGPIDAGTDAAPFMLDFDNNGTFDLLVGNGEGLLYYYDNTGNNTSPAFGTPSTLNCLDGSPINVESSCTPWMADWNNDGRKDLLLGSGSGALMLSINQGSDSRPLFAPLRQVSAGATVIRSDGPSTPCIVDWNQDGQLDVLMGTGNGYIHVYYMAAGQKEPVLSADELIQLNGQALMLEGAPAPFPVDWNHDGQMDLLIGMQGGGVYCLK